LDDKKCISAFKNFALQQFPTVFLRKLSRESSLTLTDLPKSRRKQQQLLQQPQPQQQFSRKYRSCRFKNVCCILSYANSCDMS